MLSEEVSQVLKDRRESLRIKNRGRRATTSWIEQGSSDKASKGEEDIQEKQNLNLVDHLQSMLASDHLKEILKDPNGVKYFRAFLQKELSEESLDFYEDVNKYSQIKDESALHAKAKEIWKTYIADSAEKEINIPAPYKKKIKNDIETEAITPDLFRSCQRNIFQLLESDSFRRFLLSPEYKEFLKRRGYKKVKKIKRKEDPRSAERFVLRAALSEELQE